MRPFLGRIFLVDICRMISHKGYRHKRKGFQMIYRGFDIEFNGAVWQIFERGKLIDDAATQDAAEDRVNVILLSRRAEDQADAARPYGRLA